MDFVLQTAIFSYKFPINTKQHFMSKLEKERKLIDTTQKKKYGLWREELFSWWVKFRKVVKMLYLAICIQLTFLSTVMEKFLVSGNTPYPKSKIIFKYS